MTLSSRVSEVKVADEYSLACDKTVGIQGPLTKGPEGVILEYLRGHEAGAM